MEDDPKKMEDNLKQNRRRPLKKNGRLPTKKNGIQPQAQLKNIKLNRL
jgi:hypothetical protein